MELAVLTVPDRHTEEREYIWGCPTIKSNMKLLLDRLEVGRNGST